MAENTEEVVGLVCKIAAESSDFQTQLSTLNRQMKVLQSDYKASSSASKDFDKSMEGLQTKAKYLNDSLKVQQQVVDAYASKMEKSKDKIAKLGETQEELKAKIDSTKTAFETAAQLYGKDSEEAQKLANELKELQKEYDKNNDKINNASRQLDTQTIAYNNARTTLNNYNNQLEETNNAMQQMGNASGEVAQDMNSLNSTGNPFESFTGGVKDALSQTSIFGINLGDLGGALTGAIDPTTLLSGAVAGLAAKLTEMAVQAITQCIEKINEFIDSTMQLGEEFQRQMSRVEALSGASASELGDLSDTARQMGSDTIYSAKQAAEGLEYMALAGWNAEESAKGLPTILNLAAASAMELGEASDIVTDYLTAFNMTVDESARLADVMCYAQSNSNTTTQLLGESYKDCASTCASFGLSVEETTAWLGKMADAGKKGGEAGTALNSVLSRLYGQNKTTSKALAEYGLSCFEASGKAKSFTQVMKELQDAMAKMSDKEKDAFARNVAGTSQLAAFNVMIAQSADGVAKFTKELENAGGESERQAKVMADNIYGLKASITSKIEDIKLSISTAMQPLQSMFLKLSETLLNLVAKFLKPVGDFIGALLEPIQTIFNAIMDIAQILTDIIAPMITGPLTVLTSILKGVGLVIKAICDGIVGIVDVFKTDLAPAMDSFKALGEVILKVFEAIANKIAEIFDFLKSLVQYFTVGAAHEIAALGSLIIGETDEAKKHFEEANKMCDDVWKKFFKIFGVNVDDMIDKSEELGESMEENIKTIAEVCGLETDHIWESFGEMYEAIQELDDETYKQLKDNAEEFKSTYDNVMDALDQYESDMVKKKVKRWEDTHKSMAGTQNWYIKRAEYTAKQEELYSLRTANKRDQINKQYTNKMEQEFKKQQQLQQGVVTNNASKYTEDYKAFVKNEESKTKKLAEEIKKRNELNNDYSVHTASVAGVRDWYDDGVFSKVKGYATGTENHPGGLCIVGEKGPELANISRGSTISSNNDTGTLLMNAMKPTNEILVRLDQRLTSLEQIQRTAPYEELGLANM